MKIFCKRNITVYTIIAILVAILAFEVGYCNTSVIEGIIKGTSYTYNFSLCRLIIYLILIIIYISFKNKFIEKSIESFEKKEKRIVTYIVIVCSIIFSIIRILKIFKYTEIGIIRTNIIYIIVSILTSLFVIYISNDIKKNVIVTACTLGIIFTFTTSFNHAIDEKKHFMSALNVSFFNFDYVKNPITDSKIEQLPQITKFTNIDDFLKNDYSSNVTDNVDMDDIPSTPADYSVTTYLFAGVGIAIARILGGSIIDMYILGRVMNLVIYTIFIYLAISILPYKKNIFYIIAFMPFMLLLASSYSGDGICLGMIYVFVAYCLNLHKQDKDITLKQFLLLCFLYCIMILGKGTAYMAIGSIVFMLPLYRTIKKNKKYWTWMIVSAIIVVMIGIVFVLYMKDKKLSAPVDSRGGNNINAAEQLKVILTHPIFDIKLAVQHIKVTLLNFNWYSQLHQKTFFTENSSYVMFAMMLFILYVSVTEDEYNFKLREKSILIIAFLLAFGMSSAILYLTFTPVGVLYIAGYQGRYIFPLLPILLSCLSSNRLKYSKTEERNRNVAICSGIFLIIGLMQLIIV